MSDNKIVEYQIYNLAEQKDENDKVSTDRTVKSKSRQSFRLPAKDLSPPPVIAMIDGISYEVIDIGSKGLGLAVDNPGVFKVGEKHSVTLVLNDLEMSMQGQVMHVSRDISGNIICGFELGDMDKESEQKLHTYLLEQRGEIFSAK
ncbi:MAG: PilZ domain-containing protein [Proteobacteria bacterium]|nr:PilZ domain-containing protein [Pseudomonadota bacterium]MBU1715948.1 PilZ domain-containing protein [Pseudomonadota bacterium]